MWRDMLAVRAGWQTLFQTDSELGLTFGFGVKSKLGSDNQYRLDYAWADHTHLNETHRLTLVVVF
jgi:hypothetical protein